MNFGFLRHETTKLRPQRIMVKSYEVCLILHQFDLTYCSFAERTLVTIEIFLLNFFGGGGGSECVTKW